MYTIVGLQNPGATYEHSRHNVGGVAVRGWMARVGMPSLSSSAKYSSEMSEGVVAGEDVRVLLPETFMNASGSAVVKAVTPEAVSKLTVVYDDIDVPIGSFKIVCGRGSGGHNGVQSIIDALGSKEFIRVRIGIAPVSLFGTMRKPAREKVPSFVLKDFSLRERMKLDAVMPDVYEALDTIIRGDVAGAMNQWNRS